MEKESQLIKPTPIIIQALLALSWLTAFSAHGQITFSVDDSSWGGANSFFGDGSGMNAFRTSASPGSATAYAATSASGSKFILGFAKEMPVNTGSYDLSMTDLAVGTQLNIVLTGFTALPKYVVYTGGWLTSYNFNSSTGRLSLTATTVNAARSTSVPASSTLGSAFGLSVETGGPYDFGGSVFRTDGYWGDISSLNSSYDGQMPLAGVNFSGTAGSNVSFDAYLTTDFLGTIGINSPAECAAYLQKQSTSTSLLSISRQLYTTSGTDPYLSGGGYNFGGTSMFDINGGGADHYVLASYSNSSWSEGNIGVIPEPSALSLLAVGLGGLAMLRRRS